MHSYGKPEKTTRQTRQNIHPAYMSI